MLKRSITICTLAALTLLCSCAAKKQLAVANSEIETLNAKNNELQKNVNSLKSEAAKLTEQNKALTDQQNASLASYNSYKAKCEETERNLKIMQDTWQEEYDAMMKLAEKIEIAMEDFAEKGVDVEFKNGLVYVSLQDDLLYKSGSAKLGDEGKKALSSLATVLNDYPRLKLIVLGNTDDAKFKKGGTDNWSLSTERANGVVRVLRDDYKIDPVRMTAAGKGKYNPVADNSTAQGRAKNRRTDIILNPDLDRLWDSIRNEGK